MSRRAPYLPHVLADAREHGAGALSPAELRTLRRHLETLAPRDLVREAGPAPGRLVRDVLDEIEGALGRTLSAPELRETAALMADAAADLSKRAEHAEKRERDARLASTAERLRAAGWGRPADVLKDDDACKAARAAKEEARRSARRGRSFSFDDLR